jgi:SAM-dependent methyltransferase
MNRLEIEKIIEEYLPWYQRIELAPGLFTTENNDSWFKDDAWDNVIDDVTIQDASRFRPIPKWNYIKTYLPDLTNKTIMEIGCNCGFFSVEFSRTAKHVYGVDVSEHWLKRAKIVKDILNIENLTLIHMDFLSLRNLDKSYLDETKYRDFFSEENFSVPFERGIVDGIFCSTVIDHVYFPFFFIYKMLFNAKSFVILDTPVIDNWAPSDKFNHQKFLHIDGPSDGSHHGFSATKGFWQFLLGRLNVSPDIVAFHEYGNSNLCIVIDVSRWGPRHLGC